MNSGTKMLGIALTLALLLTPLSARAQDTTTGDTTATGDTAPAFSNPAQAAKAEAVAEAAAAKADLAAEQALAALTSAQQALAAIQADPTADPAAVAAAEQAVAEAEAKAEAAAAAVGSVSTADIAGMRAAGMGWGQIAHELGVHPSTLGLGKAAQVATRERTRTQASLGPALGRTARNMKTAEVEQMTVEQAKGSKPHMISSPWAKFTKLSTP